MAKIKRQFLDCGINENHKFVMEYDGKEIEDGVALVFSRSKINQEMLNEYRIKNNFRVESEFDPKYVIVDVATGLNICYAQTKTECLEKYENVRNKYYSLKETEHYAQRVREFKLLTTTI